ncbi:MAG: CvpA family protein [Lachnospiraceae bacterium]|nr:CvpA family protein [Lachnospiraceae bacterium]
MNIYKIITYAAFALIMIWRISRGYKKGFVAELANASAIVIALGVGYLLKNIVFGFMDQRYGLVVSSVAYLAALLLLYKIVGFIFLSLKIFAKLPVIKLIDKLLGIVLGAAEGILILMFLIWFIG